MNKKTVLYLVTFHRKDGHVFNYEISKEDLPDWLEKCHSVMMPGDALTYSEI